MAGDEDVVVSLRFWVDQERGGGEHAPGLHPGCLTCLFIEDMERAVAEIERLRRAESFRKKGL